MGDNSTSSSAAGYDAHITGVNPNYRLFHQEALDLVRSIVPSPGRWLDAGCGTGTLVRGALEMFPETEFLLADPSEAMLGIARQKLADAAQGRVSFTLAGTQDLALPDDSLDVVTAMLCHHYLSEPERKAATNNCFRMLKPGGVYVTFEHIQPGTDDGLRIALARWGRFQLAMGRTPEEVEKHRARLGREYFPITVQQHLNLLYGAGFMVAEMLFLSVMQAGFYAIKK